MMKNIVLALAVLFSLQIASSQVIPNGVYYIFSAVDGHYAIDDYGSNAFNGNNINLWTFNKTNAQKWKVENRNGGIILRSAVNNNFVIDDNGCNVYNGNNIHLWEYNGTNAQLWYPERVSSKRELFVLRSSLNRNFVIDVNGCGMFDGNNIQLWEYNGTNAQKWVFLKVGEVEFDDLMFDILFGGN